MTQAIALEKEKEGGDSRDVTARQSQDLLTEQTSGKEKQGIKGEEFSCTSFHQRRTNEMFFAEL